MHVHRRNNIDPPHSGEDQCQLPCRSSQCHLRPNLMTPVLQPGSKSQRQFSSISVFLRPLSLVLVLLRCQDPSALSCVVVVCKSMRFRTVEPADVCRKFSCLSWNLLQTHIIHAKGLRTKQMMAAILCVVVQTVCSTSGVRWSGIQLSGEFTFYGDLACASSKRRVDS
jgi:hypothetical protein